MPAATQPLFRIEQREQQHPGGRFLDWLVIDNRSGKTLAERGCRESAVGVAHDLNGAYAPSLLAPAHDSLVHEIHMTRIGGERELPLYAVAPIDLAQMIPSAVGDPLTEPMWERVLGLPDDYEEVV